MIEKNLSHLRLNRKSQVKLFLLTFLLLFNCLVHAQEVTKKGDLNVGIFTGQFLISTDLKAVYLNLVGSGIKYTRGNTSLSLGVFPTIRFYEDPHLDSSKPKKPFVAPGFSAGLLFNYKRFMIATPAFYKDDQWHFTVGMGVRFGPLK